MGYKRTHWIDHVLDGEGKVVQQGTPVDAEHLNNIEEGLENALTKDGENTIVGCIKLEDEDSSSGVIISVGEASTVITSTTDAESGGRGHNALFIHNEGHSSIEDAVQLERMKNGEYSKVTILHTGNKSLITPSDIGAAPSSHGTHVSFSSDDPLIDGTASAGSGSTVARSDHRHPTDETRAPKNHLSSGTEYGVGNNNHYGHLKLSDAVNGTSGVSGGVASTPAATKAAYDLAFTAKTAADNAQDTANGKAPAPIISQTDITAGTTPLATGQSYHVYK